MRYADFEWLFVDMGSTFVDESLCIEKRITDTIASSSITKAEFEAVMRRFARQNLDAYKSACAYFGLEKAHWHEELEMLYPGTEETLLSLKRRFKLGIIGNQPESAIDKLKGWNIYELFDAVIISSSEGFAKPDVRLFMSALNKTSCDPENACMAGDRLDNDILPAMQLHPTTVCVRQGFGGPGSAALLPCPIDYTVNSFNEIAPLLC